MKWRTQRKRITEEEIRLKQRRKGAYVKMLDAWKREPATYSRPRMSYLKRLPPTELIDTLEFSKSVAAGIAILNKLRCDSKQRMKRGAA